MSIVVKFLAIWSQKTVMKLDTSRFSHLARTVGFRYGVTLLGNGARMILNIAATVVLTRALGVDRFGNLSFLLGNFTAVSTLIDMGTSQAFFTAIAQRPRGIRFVSAYLTYQATQIVLMALIFGLVLPQSLVDAVWLGRSRELLVLAVSAVILQQQVWNTMSQIGESLRLTYRVQIFNVLVAVSHCVLLMILWFLGKVSVASVLALIIAEYLVALTLLWRWLRPALDVPSEHVPWRSVLKEYWTYSHPLFIYNGVGFLYMFADTWLLQRFGGNSQQAFYGVAVRIGAFCLMAPTAMVNVLWKEIAEAYWNDENERVRTLVERNWRLMFFVAAFSAGFVGIWSREILLYGFGAQYASGEIILLIMLINAVYTAMSQSNVIVAYATGHTRDQAVYGITHMLVSLVAVYFLVASPQAVVPGLGLGGLGVAIKMAGTSFIFVNLYSWWHCHRFGWKFRPGHQFVLLALLVPGVIVLRWVVSLPFLPFTVPLGIQALLFCLLYVAAAALFILVLPSYAGLSRGDLAHILGDWRRYRDVRIRRKNRR